MIPHTKISLFLTAFLTIAFMIKRGIEVLPLQLSLDHTLYMKFDFIIKGDFFENKKRHFKPNKQLKDIIHGKTKDN